jgi:hypothetical protein
MIADVKFWMVLTVGVRFQPLWTVADNFELVRAKFWPALIVTVKNQPELMVGVKL